MRKLFIALLSALLCLLLSVSALAADGLSTFQETQTYQPGMFSDVKAGSWYEAGVRAVYTRGIMNGTAEKLSLPARQSPGAGCCHCRAHPRRLAAARKSPPRRVSGTSRTSPMPRRQSCCRPPARRGAAAASTTITRQELAGLFANVLRAGRPAPAQRSEHP